jgi:four helix bundle protein
MSDLGLAKSYKDLVVYKKAREVAKEIYVLSKAFPREEQYSLTDQVRRSSRSVGAQIAEAWARRRYARHFESKLSDADGEQLETQHWLDSAMDCGLMADPKVQFLNSKLDEIGRMLNSMVLNSHLFCREKNWVLHDEHAEYFTAQSVID